MVSAVYGRSIVQQGAQESALQNPFSQKVIQAVRSRWSFLNRSMLQREIADLNSNELKQLLDAVVLEIKPEEVERFGAMVSLEALQNAVRIQYPEHVNGLQSAKQCFHEAKYFLEIVDSKTAPTLKSRLVQVLNVLIAIVESILTAFGVADFFKPPENSGEGEFKSQKIMLLLTLFSLLSTLLLPILGAALVGMIVGSSLLAIAALSILYPYFKPPASKLPRAENWTQQLNQGNLFVADGRKGTLDEIAQTLIASKEVKTHVMLIGKTGIGKTETAKAFVQAVERGDYPELKGKQIFYLNAADLLSETEFSGANKILSQLSEAMGRHREKMILVIDEIHMVCQKRENVVLSDQLKTFLDPGKENFPYVIGITTEEEYFREIHANQAAFARRFKRIPIENTGDAETLKILSNAFLRQAPKTLLEQGALQMLLQKTKVAFGEQAAQPGASLKILSQCIKQTSNSQKLPLQIRIERMREHLQTIYSQGVVGQGNGLLPYGRENLAPLEQQLKQLEADFQVEKEKLLLLDQARGKLADVKIATFRTIFKTSKLGLNALSEADKKQLGTYLIQSHFQAPLLEAKIRKEARLLGAKTIVDEALIDEVIAEELENEARAHEVILRGRAQIAARQM
ncbi:MAG: AAA family ATPase [Chlamydiota bacterium]